MGTQGLKAVTFDAGGTLLYPHPSVGEIYAETARRFGAEVETAKMEQAFRQAWVAGHRPEVSAQVGNSNRPEWWRWMVFLTLDLAGVTMADREGYFLSLYNQFSEPAVWRLFPDAITVIQEVRAMGLKVGLISNWDHRLRPVLTGLGLEPLLDTVCISCEVGSEKPDGRIFQIAQSALGVDRADQVLHVGDSYREDILGATAAGMQAVLVERVKADHWDGPTITRLAELREIAAGCRL